MRWMRRWESFLSFSFPRVCLLPVWMFSLCFALASFALPFFPPSGSTLTIPYVHQRGDHATLHPCGRKWNKLQAFTPMATTGRNTLSIKNTAFEHKVTLQRNLYLRNQKHIRSEITFKHTPRCIVVVMPCNLPLCHLQWARRQHLCAGTKVENIIFTGWIAPNKLAEGCARAPSDNLCTHFNICEHKEMILI